MDKLLSFLQVKPKLYEKTQYNIWDNDYVSKGMLQAHLDESLDSASRNIKFVNKSVNWISELFPPTKYHNLLDLAGKTMQPLPRYVSAEFHIRDMHE